MLNEFAGKVIEGVISDLFTELAKQAYAGYKDLRSAPAFDTHKYESEWESAAKRYQVSLDQQFGQMRILEMRHGVEFPRLLVRARLTTEISSQAGRDKRDVDQSFIAGLTQRRPAVDGLSQVVAGSKLLLLGGPGSGKTSFLIAAALQTLKSGSHSGLPVFVSLRDTALKHASLTDAIEDKFARLGMPLANRFVATGLDSGKFVVLLDGLDEVPSESLETIVKQIDEMSERHRRLTVLVSCRDGSYEYWLREFILLELLPFTKAQIATFVQNWFAEEPSNASRLLERLTDRRVVDCVSVPLLLALLCLSFEANREVPLHKAAFFEDAVDVLFRRWDVSRRIDRSNATDDTITRTRARELLSALAYEALTTGRYSWTRFSLATAIDRHFGERRRRGDKLRPDSEKVITQLKGDYGLLIQPAKDLYSFLHVGFLEFLSAEYIVNNTDALAELASNQLFTERFREVATFVAAKLPDPDPFVGAIVSAIESAWPWNALAAAMQRVIARFENETPYTPITTLWHALVEVLFRATPWADSIDEILAHGPAGPHVQFLAGIGTRCDYGAPLRSQAPTADSPSTWNKHDISFVEQLNWLQAVNRSQRAARMFGPYLKTVGYVPFRDGKTVDHGSTDQVGSWRPDPLLRDLLDGKRPDSPAGESLQVALHSILTLSRILDGYLRSRLLALQAAGSTSAISEGVYDNLIEWCEHDCERLVASLVDRTSSP